MLFAGNDFSGDGIFEGFFGADVETCQGEDDAEQPERMRAGAKQQSRDDGDSIACDENGPAMRNMLSSEQHDEETDGLDLFGLSRYLHHRGEAQRAEVACTAARERGLPIGFDALAQWELARMAKKRGEHGTAAEIWEELSRDDDWRAAACKELASFHERRKKDHSKALKYARQAIVALRKQAAEAKHGAQVTAAVRRFERLNRKIICLESRLQKSANTPPLLRTPAKSRGYREPEIAS